MAEKKTASKYIETVGRRKTSTARVRITPNKSLTIKINDRDYDIYFGTKELQKIITEAFNIENLKDKFDVTVRVVGGGIHSQAEAIRHGIARALIEREPELRKQLKKAGFLKRDPRMKERRKFGLKKARKSPQWSKR